MDYEWNEEEHLPTQTFYNDQRSSRGNRDQYNSRQRNDRFSSGRNRNWRDRNTSDDQKRDNQKQTIKVPSKCVGRIIGTF